MRDYKDRSDEFENPEDIAKAALINNLRSRCIELDAENRPYQLAQRFGHCDLRDERDSHLKTNFRTIVEKVYFL